MIIKELKLEGVKIVEFEPRYAAGIADMWNASAEGWNGEEWEMTEEKVLNEEACCNYIALYLIVNEQDEVYGYCKIEEYKDAKSVYIPLLNVTPKCYGKKYGKALLIKALQRVVDDGYERLDLHSWAGNTKAVPLYKKMGFRWQTNRRGVYMMNYLPLLLNLQVLNPYFEEINWYTDAICDLSLEPDSVMDKGFETLLYRWEKNGRFVEAAFNIEAKGMHRLACNDFEIILSADNKDLFFGKHQLELITRLHETEQDLKIAASGSGAVQVEETLRCIGKAQRKDNFEIVILDEKKDTKKDAAKLNLSIGSMNIPLELGINPKPPVKVSLKAEERVFRSGKSVVYMQLENNLNVKASVNIVLRSSEDLEFNQKKSQYILAAKSKRAVPINCQINKGLFYDEKIDVCVATDSDKIQYRQRLRCMIPDKETIIFGEKENSWFMHKENIHLLYGKDRTYAPCRLEIEDTNFWFFYRNPTLSEPYAMEFNNQKPEAVEFERTGQDVLMKVQFTGRTKKIRVFHHLLFRHDNSFTSKWEVCNLSESPIKIDQLESCFDMAATHGGFDGDIIKMTANDRDCYWLFLPEKSKMNGWDYYQADGMNAALIWDENLKHSSGEFWQRVFYDLGEIIPGKSKFIGNEELLLNRFPSCKEFYRWYYGNKDFPLVKGLQQLVLNDGNPFAGDKIELRFCDITHKSGKKTVRILMQDQLLEETEYLPGILKREIPFCSKVKIELSSESVTKEISQVLYRKSNKPSLLRELMLESEQVQSQKTDLLELISAKNFLAGVYSLKYQGCEIFSSSFPQAIPRGWDNNWKGGLITKPLDISSTMLDKQNYEMEFVNRRDNYGNFWEGFAFSCRYDDFVPYYDGVKVRFNYLLAPSHDIIAVFPEIVCSGGKFIPHLKFNTTMFLNEKNQMNFLTESEKLRISDKMAGFSELTTAHVELTEKQHFINCISDKGKMYINLQSNMGMVAAEHVIRNIKPDIISAATPLIMVFSPNKLSKDELAPLMNLCWR